MLGPVYRSDAGRRIRRLASPATRASPGGVAVVLLVLLAAEGATIPFIGPLLQPHILIGMLLIPPVMLKLGSTGYRFVRYYAGTPAYVRKGPPPLLLRLLAPGVVLTTVALFGTGVALLLAGPPSNTLDLAHKVSFIAWVALMTAPRARPPARGPAAGAPRLAPQRARVRRASPEPGLRIVARSAAPSLAGIALALLAISAARGPGSDGDGPDFEKDERKRAARNSACARSASGRGSCAAASSRSR